MSSEDIARALALAGAEPEMDPSGEFLVADRLEPDGPEGLTARR